MDIARRGDSVAMKLEPSNATEASRLYGRHFTFHVRPYNPCTTLETPLRFRSLIPVAAQSTRDWFENLS